MARKKIFDILDIITNVLIVPVLLIGLFCSILMFSAKQHNGVPSLFGYSAVRILTGSMHTSEQPEFAEGNVVLVKKVNPETLKVGDIIAFYKYVAPEDEETIQTFASASTLNVNLNFSDYVGGTTNEASSSGSDVIFHRIVDIKHQDNKDTGEIEHYFFETKGDNNQYSDSYVDSENQSQIAYIRDDFVVGVYTPSSGFVTGLFSFCASTTGIVCLVLLPAGIILVMVSISLVEQIKSASNEKKENRKKLIETEKLLQGESTSANTTNLNTDKTAKQNVATNVPPKASNPSNAQINAGEKSAVPPKAPIPPKATPSTTAQKTTPSVPPKAPTVKAEQPKTTATASKTAKSTAVPPKAPTQKTTTSSTTAKTSVKASTPAKASVPPKAPAKAGTPPKAPPVKPSDKK